MPANPTQPTRPSNHLRKGRPLFDLEFYLARAAQARRQAEEATLDHVRERCRRAVVAWTAFAARAARTEQLRIAVDQRNTQQPDD